MVTIAEFGGGPSTGARLGAALGGGFQESFAPAFAKKQEDIALQARLAPIFEALQSSVGGIVPSSPGQALVQQLTKDPELFAQVMQDPSQLNNLAAVNSLAAERPTGTGFEELDEINKTFELARKATEAGEARRAEVLQNRLNDLTGGNVDLTRDIVHRIPNGTDEIQTIQSDGQGGFFDLQGKEITLDNGDRILESFSISDTSEGALSTTETKTLNDAEIATRNFLGTASDALTLLASEPNINTLTGRAASVFNDLKAEARAVAENFGLEFDTSALEPATHDEQFTRLGIDNARQRSLITSLAFQAAAAAAPGDRVTERDIERFIEEVGGSANDPATFSAVLNDLAARTVRNMNNQIRVRLKPKNFEVSDFGLSELPGFTAAPSQRTSTGNADDDDGLPGDLTNLTDEEFLDLL